MPRSKKPVLIVAAILVGLIVLPMLILLLSKLGGDGGRSPGGGSSAISSGAAGASSNFDLRQLQERAQNLVDGEIAQALRRGDVSLDFVAGLNDELERAQSAMEKGQPERAESIYAEVIAEAEAQLEVLSLADKARALNDRTYQELQRLDYLKGGFERAYGEAVQAYNSGLGALNAGAYEASIGDFEKAGAILTDLEGRANQQIAGLLESAKSLLAKDNLHDARAAYEAVLKIDPSNTEATDGLEMLASLEGIAAEMRAIRELEEAGELERALSQLDALLEAAPANAYIREQRERMAEKILQRDIRVLVEKADAFEEAGDLDQAIAALEEAIALRASPPLSQRVAALKEKQKAAKLDQLLADGFNALKAGRYQDARDLYKEAVDLEPKSKEAQLGYEKASSLYLAFIRYDQNLGNAARFMKEGRYPMAAKFFNTAMSSRPNNVPASQQKKEDRIRADLDKQNVETPVQIISDKRTYVSIIRVFAPERFKDKELSLFPDVYTVKGTRSGYKTVEVELRVDATKPNQTVEVICTEKL